MYYANTTAPPQILSGGWGTVPVNMSLLWEKFRNYSEKLKEQLGIANITKDEARAEAAEKWFSIAVGSAITFILVGGVPFTASAMLALMPLSVAALLLGEDVFVGAIISAINNRINLILLGLSISLAVYHTYLAIDPEGEIYVLGY
jgi:succinate dehydrogenase hydrophobic anchor subunit